jgi:molybdenum cofactor guanylyltransferase
MATSEGITGFVLAGGRSRRMGRDKVNLPWRDGTLLSHAVDTLAEVAAKVLIVSPFEAPHSPAQVIADQFNDLGPLAGIHTALSATATDWNLMLAVDLPLVSASLLRFITDACRHAQEQVVIPQVQGTLQTLCAAYHRSLLPRCETALRAGELSILDFLAGRSLCVIEEAELAARGFSPDMFLNVNTPEDMVRACAVAESR